MRHFKQSPLSLMIALFSNLNEWPNMSNVKKLLEQAEVHDGVPGCGKTYTIA